MTKTQEKMIMRLRKSGKSIKAIAKELHLSDRTVSAFIKANATPTATAKKSVNGVDTQRIPLPKLKKSALAIAKKTTKKNQIIKDCDEDCDCPCDGKNHTCSTTVSINIPDGISKKGLSLIHKACETAAKFVRAVCSTVLIREGWEEISNSTCAECSANDED